MTPDECKMDVSELISRLQSITINESDIKRIIEQINRVAEMGYSSLIYDIDDKDCNELCQKIKDTFPEISIQILGNSILFDWS
jgi:ribosomal protein L12E/L44/L45/RPP1/RPP2